MSRASEGTGLVKRQWRLTLRQKLHALSKEMKAEASVRASQLLVAQRFWLDARSLLFYAPLEDELDLWPLIEVARSAGKQAALPQYDPETDSYVACVVTDALKETSPGKFGIREPRPGCPELAINRLDLALVPGVGFDLLGYRLGRGRGYYDRLLGQRPGCVCGVAFDEQIVDELPVGPHDRQMDCILTPSRCFEL